MPRGKQLAEKNTSRKEYSKITTFLGFQTCHFFSLLKKASRGTIYVLAGNAGVMCATALTDSCYSQVRVDGDYCIASAWYGCLTKEEGTEVNNWLSDEDYVR